VAGWASEAVYWLPLVAAVVFLVAAMNGGYVGECSAATGYEPELGFMAGAPWLPGFVGLTEAVVAAASRWPRRVPMRLGLVGVAVVVLAIGSHVVASMSAYSHACDGPSTVDVH
jgi:hypothetical protein